MRRRATRKKRRSLPRGLIAARRTARRAAIVALIFLGAPLAAAAEAPEGFRSTHEELSALIDGSNAGPIEIARGAYLASWFYSVGSPGLESAREWFRRATTRGRAGTAALFLAMHGTPDDHAQVRGGLERDPSKHRWLYGLVGNERNLRRSLRDVEVWTPIVKSLPGTSGCRALSLHLLESPDPLVRRGGLYLGFWFATPPYWQEVRRRAVDDDDPTTREAARILIARGGAS